MASTKTFNELLSGNRDISLSGKMTITHEGTAVIPGDLDILSNSAITFECSVLIKGYLHIQPDSTLTFKDQTKVEHFAEVNNRSNLLLEGPFSADHIVIRRSSIKAKGDIVANSIVSLDLGHINTNGLLNVDRVTLVNGSMVAKGMKFDTLKLDSDSRVWVNENLEANTLLIDYSIIHVRGKLCVQGTCELLDTSTIDVFSDTLVKGTTKVGSESKLMVNGNLESYNLLSLSKGDISVKGYATITDKLHMGRGGSLKVLSKFVVGELKVGHGTMIKIGREEGVWKEEEADWAGSSEWKEEGVWKEEEADWAGSSEWKEEEADWGMNKEKNGDSISRDSIKEETSEQVGLEPSLVGSIHTSPMTSISFRGSLYVNEFITIRGGLSTKGELVVGEKIRLYDGASISVGEDLTVPCVQLESSSKMGVGGTTSITNVQDKEILAVYATAPKGLKLERPNKVTPSLSLGGGSKLVTKGLSSKGPIKMRYGSEVFVLNESSVGNSLDVCGCEVRDSAHHVSGEKIDFPKAKFNVANQLTIDWTKVSPNKRLALSDVLVSVGDLSSTGLDEAQKEVLDKYQRNGTIVIGNVILGQN